MRRLLRWFTPARLAPITTGIVFAAAFVVSFDALMSLARAAGIREILTPAYPLLVDALMATGTVAAVALRTAPLRTRAYCWFLIAAGIAVSVLGNAVHSQAHESLPWWAAAGASAVPALSLAASLHLLVIVLRHVRHDGHDAALEVAHETAPVQAAEMSVLAAHQEAPNGRQAERQSDTRRRDNRRRLARLIKARPEVSASEAAKRLGVSRSTAARLLTEVRKSHAQEPVTN
jgi:hypothetical protein